MARSESAASAGRPMSSQCIRGQSRRQRGVRAVWRIARACRSSASARARSAVTARSSAWTDDAWDLVPSRRRMSATVTGSSRSRSSSDSAVGGGPVSGVGGALPVRVAADWGAELPAGLLVLVRLPPGRSAGGWGPLPVGDGCRRGASGAVGRSDAHHAPLRPLERRERIAIQLGGTPPQVLAPFDLDDPVVEGVRLEADPARPIIQNIGLGLQIAGAVRRRGDRQRPRLDGRGAQSEAGLDVDQTARQRLGVCQPRAQAVVVAHSAHRPLEGVDLGVDAIELRPQARPLGVQRHVPGSGRGAGGGRGRLCAESRGAAPSVTASASSAQSRAELVCDIVIGVPCGPIE